MTAPRLWIRSSHHAAFRCGGWAWVMSSPVEGLRGQAGGDRGVSASRTLLAGIAAGLKAAPAGGELAVDVAAPGLWPRLSSLGEGRPPEPAPDEDLDLWAQIATALKGRRLAALEAPPGVASFAEAWAELARDKAKAAGAFAAAIPKPNLAKLSLG